MNFDDDDDWPIGRGFSSDNEDDDEIAGIVDMRASGAELRQRPDYPAWLETQRTKCRSRYDAPFDEGSAWRDYRTHLESRNESLRRAHRQGKKCRQLLVDRCARHGELVLSPDFDTTAPVIAALENWAKDTRTMAVLSGPTGTGKTTAAAYASLHLADGEPGQMPRWITASTFARSSRYDDDRDKVLDARALVLDDLGSEFNDSKGSFRTDLDELIDRFYARKARLIITTNLDAKTFEERYGARVVDRLAEAGVWIPVTGTSRRRKAK